jgi:hypothetical protein
MSALFSAIASLLWALLIGWVGALADLYRRLVGLIRATLDRENLPGRQSRDADTECVPIRHPAFRRPDPLIYAQEYLMGLGLAVTWDNPDIELRCGGVAVSSDAIEPDTDYEIVARIWNGSTNAPVVGMPVDFSYLTFGIGAMSTPIGTAVVDLGVKGGPGCPTFASMPWRSPVTPGHYCIQVRLIWNDDTNPLNNLGQENLSVQATQSPTEFTFLVHNTDDRPHAFALEVDAYALPEVASCDVTERPSRRELLRRTVEPPSARLMPRLHSDVRRRHDRASYPVPPGWSIGVPTELTLEAGAEREVRVMVEPAAGFVGRQPLNVRAVDGDYVAGGVTLIVEAV